MKRRLDWWFLSGALLLGFGLGAINPWWLIVMVGICLLAYSFDNYTSDKR